MELNMSVLEEVFNEAITLRLEYVGVLIEMEGFPKPELIINEFENLQLKLDYYKKTYDENLNHKFSKGIKIIDVSGSDHIEDIEFELITVR